CASFVSSGPPRTSIDILSLHDALPISLENEIEDVKEPFIKKGILLAVDGVEPEVINDIMNAEITAMEERHYRGRMILEKCAEYADRKSTRLNSSHVKISYAVFCLKKKK